MSFKNPIILRKKIYLRLLVGFGNTAASWFVNQGPSIHRSISARHLRYLLFVFFRYLHLSFLIKLYHECLFVRRHGQLLEALRQAMLSFFEGTLAGQTHLVAEFSRIVSMLCQPDALENATTIGRYFIQFDATFANSSRLVTL